MKAASKRMKPPRFFSRISLVVAAAAGTWLSTGCGNIFVARHKVLVDAISAPEAVKPAGQSYRLVAKTAVVKNAPMQVSVVKACIDAALTSAGMFEAPPNVAPDVFIEVSYGTDSGPRVDPSARETFLQLSGRANSDRELERTKGPEVWDVRVGVMGVAGRPESALPLLASVAVKHIGTDTKAETKVEIPQNEPTIAAVRETAIKALEARAAPPVDASAAPTPSAPPETSPPPAETIGPATPPSTAMPAATPPTAPAKTARATALGERP